MENSTTLKRITDHIKINEREDTNYPYLDVKGKLTAGIGFLVDDEASFVSLPFRIGDRLATEHEKRTGFQTMLTERNNRDGHFNREADNYADKTPLRLDQGFMDQRLAEEIQTRIGKIKTRLDPGTWDKLTDGQKTLLVDVHYANGSLENFPNLVKAANAEDAQGMAQNSLFLADSHRGVRHDDRNLANFAAALGRSPKESAVRAEYEAHRDRANAAWHAKAVRNLHRITDPDERKVREEYLRTHPFAGKVGADTSEPTNTPEANRGSSETDETNRQGRAGDDALGGKVASAINSYLAADGDVEDEALLKDDLTDDEVKAAMHSRAYNDEKDPRFEAVNKRVQYWYEDRYGNEETRTDATGKMIQPKRKLQAPNRPMASSVARTGVPISAEVGRVVDKLFSAGPVNFKPEKRTPTFATSAKTVPAQPSPPKGEGSPLAFPQVVKLQKALNKDNFLLGGIVPDTPLKEDGIAGPKTRRALRRTISRFGADGMIRSLI